MNTNPPKIIPAVPAPGRAAARRVVLAEAECVWWAPHVFRLADRTALLATRGKRSDMVFAAKRWKHRAKPERWYTGGRNQLWFVDFGGPIADRPAGVVLPEPRDAQDVMGATTLVEGEHISVWFSARNAQGSWGIYSTGSHTAGRTWSEPVLSLAPGQGTESEHVFLPSIVPRDGVLHMWYAGRDGHNRRIHHATSGDGSTWDRHGVVVDLGAENECDEYATDCPSVIALPNGDLLMAYGAGTSRSIAAAVSADGVTWRKLGPFVHRGSGGDPDTKYAFYPTLSAGNDGTVGLHYAGESTDGVWSVIEFGDLDLDALLARPKPCPVSAGTCAGLASILNDVGQEFLDTPPDSFGAAPAYRSADGSIVQLRPSSSPVFRVGLGDECQVVKLGRTRPDAEREYDGYQALAGHLPLQPAALRYIGDNAFIILPYKTGGLLAELATADPDRFRGLLIDCTARFAALFRATLSDPYPAHVEYSGQTPALLAEWVQELEDLCDPWLDLPLVVNGTSQGAALRDLLAIASAAVGSATPYTTLSTGDNHLRNIIVTADGWTAIDLEYFGPIDLDYSIAKFLGSCIKHTDLIDQARAEVEDGRLEISYVLDEWAHSVLDGMWPAEQFSPLPVQWRRVLGFIVAKLVFRFRSDLAKSPQAPPSTALAMAGIALGLTGGAGSA